jgi:hypothetical protein
VKREKLVPESLKKGAVGYIFIAGKSLFKYSEFFWREKA